MPSSPPSPTAALRTAVVGCGLIAQAIHLPRLRRLNDRFEVVALADRSETVRERLAARYAPARAYADWRALLEREPLDAVVVCAPHATHAPVTLAALDLGLHVLVEKPLSITLADADTIVRRQRESGRVVQVGYMRRHHPAFAALLAELPGDPGGLRLADAVTYDPWMARAPHVPWDDLVFGSDVPAAARSRDERARHAQLAAATGSDDPRVQRAFEYTYLACLIHDVNLMHGVLDRLGVAGEATPLSARHRDDGLAADVALRLPGGQTWRSAWLQLDRQPAFRSETTVHLLDRVAALRLRTPYRVDLPARVRCGDDAGVRTRELVADPYENELVSFHACATTGAECVAPARQGRRDLELLTRLHALAVAHAEPAPLAAVGS